LVVSQFIEITELLHVQGPKNIKAADYNLHADGPFEGKNDFFDPVPRHSKMMFTSTSMANFSCMHRSDFLAGANPPRLTKYF
jgi:hypothetical protein